MMKSGWRKTSEKIIWLLSVRHILGKNDHDSCKTATSLSGSKISESYYFFLLLRLNLAKCNGILLDVEVCFYPWRDIFIVSCTFQLPYLTHDISFCSLLNLLYLRFFRSNWHCMLVYQDLLKNINLSRSSSIILGVRNIRQLKHVYCRIMHALSTIKNWKLAFENQGAASLALLTPIACLSCTTRDRNG